ncbi:Uu.00g128680.m01.CDS01 [Anthostomella pinea]|uniref:Uu.00g128680.m01.CDS01 n=1 Tax=Anthostomella pinea TaxID=933095 RepID=A0AAI8YI01_9PEZI|nr:Uu.00g128680.m01.CDS01 [Anthostomella pinea]
MPSFNPFTTAISPFTTAASRNACALFEIRLDNDFIVLRGGDDEASGQLLKGVLVLCLREQLKCEDVHLRLQGECRVAWLDGKQTPSGIHNQKVDRTTTILKHNWPPFVGESNHHNTLQPGNYEWPFEFLLPGDTAESVEGLYQTGITYVLKATVSRGKLAKNYHAYKRLRIIRTLEPAALEFNHAMSVENIWPNKIEYSVVIPQKAVVFGSNVPLEMRFTPLLKGLEMGTITVKLIEIQEFTVSGYAIPTRSHKRDRDVHTWTFEVNRDTDWQNNIEETGQEGWVVNKELPMPKKLSKCIQDCTVHGIKIRHKLKLTVALKNPDGHVSELRATLPVTIFISPNMPLDDEGNIVSQAPETTAGDQRAEQTSNMAPPGYGQHVLDQLYDDVDPSGIMTPGLMTPGIQSGISSPFYAQSRAGSSENLASMAHAIAVPPAALSSRLQNVSLDRSRRTQSYISVNGLTSGATSGAVTPYHEGDHTAESSAPHSAELSRHPSSEEEHPPGRSGHGTPPEHDEFHAAEFPDMDTLSKVPSYTTATRAPLPRTPSYTGSLALPDYRTAMSAPSSPTRVVLTDPMDTIAELLPADGSPTEVASSQDARSRSSSRNGHGHGHGSRGSSVGGFSFFPGHAAIGGADSERRLRLLQGRSG